jgi:hypothetical protein
MDPERPWRRDAWQWALKYGALATITIFGYQRERVRVLDPSLTWRQQLMQDIWMSLLLGVFCALAVFVWRFRGALVDLDELQAVGRGGLGLPREGLTRKPASDKGDRSEHPTSPGSA